MSRHLVACDAGGTMTDAIVADEELVEIGYPHSLKTLLSYGGISSNRYPRLVEAAMSGFSPRKEA